MTDAHRYVDWRYTPDSPVNRMRLNDVMELGAAVRILEDGTAVRYHGDHPDVALFLGGSDGDLVLEDMETGEEFDKREWVPERGWSMQSGYAGPVMHDSEFIGGKLADHILETPGVWVAIPADHYAPDEDCVSEGWVLLHNEYK